MKLILFLSWQYLRYDRLRTAIMILALTTVFFLPTLLNLVTSVSSAYLTGRSESTPLVMGSAGSSLDLVMEALYFRRSSADDIRWSDIQDIREYNLGRVIPMHTGFTAQAIPVVGTTLSYFGFRNLRVETGRMFGVLGECVLGHEAAQRLGLGVGDSIITDSENPFDLAGSYPLKMRIVGILESASSWDDKAVFCDVKTSWVIGGEGHGHENLENPDSASAVLSREGGNIVANASLIQYNEITPENIAGFHFHGDISGFPLPAAIVLPDDERSQALLLGKFADNHGNLQLVEPGKVILKLLDTLFRIKEILQSVVAVTLTVTILSIGFILSLSIRLRKEESLVLFRIGGSRSMILILTIVETTLLAAAALVLAALLLLGAWTIRDVFIEMLIRG